MKKIVWLFVFAVCLFYLPPKNGLAQNKNYQPANNQKMVALTFDDGPNPKTTKEMVDILGQFNASATFFVIGENAKRYPSLVMIIVNSGNEVGNHTWDHPQCQLISLTAFKKELETTNSEIEKITGNSPKLFRFPYGSSTSKERLMVRDKGMIPVLWTIDPRDWENPSVNYIVNYVLSQAHEGSIILFHEGKKNTLKALPIILKALQEKELRPVTVSQLLRENAR